MSRVLVFSNVATGELLQIGDDGVVRPYAGPELSKQASATEWLRARLADGPVSSATISAELAKVGFSRRYIRYVAAKRLGVVVFRKGGYGAHGAWYWKLPKLEALAAPSVDVSDLKQGDI